MPSYEKLEPVQAYVVTSLLLPAGIALVVLVRFVESSTDLAATNALIERVRGLASELEPTTFHPEMKVEFGGGLTKRQAQYQSIVDDILASAGVTVLGVFLLLALYFRRARAVVVVVVCGALLGAFVHVFCVSGCPVGVGDPFLGTLGARRRGVPGSWSGGVVGRVPRVLVSVGVVVRRWVWACRGPWMYHRIRYGQVRTRFTFRQKEKNAI